MINDNIRNLRENILSISQESFATAIGLKRNTISLIENGKRNPSNRTIKDICSVFHVNEDWLITGNGDPILDMDEDEEFVYLVGQFSAENDAYKKRIIKAMLSIEDRESWELITKMVEKLSSLENLKNE